MEPDFYYPAPIQDSQPYDVRLYQTTHTTGGVIMDENPARAALNRYLQHWDYDNLFVPGVNAFPQNLQQNPTGTVGALTYWMIATLKNDYLRNPRSLG